MTTKTPTPTSAAADERAAQRLQSALRPHPRADLIPAIGRREFAAFRGDIADRGIQVPLEITRESVILDGHLRLRAAIDLGLESVPVRLVAPADEVEYLLLAALERRQLTASQRAALAVELDQYRQTREQARARSRANLKGQPLTEVAKLPPRGKTRDHAATLAGVSARTIQDAATVQAQDPQLFEQVKHGKLPVDRAARQVRQRERDCRLASSPITFADGLYDLIYADPPWRLPGRPDSSRAVENHYPTMPLDQIKQLAVPAARSCVLYLWAVNSLLKEALEVVEAWGFRYLTNYAWVKDKWGLGQWNRTQHELLLVAVLGEVPPPATGMRKSSVINAARRAHSQKPDEVYDLLDWLHPHARKLELFARGTSRPGWTAWGNEADNG
jgi:N6-adenosine-specific RNA methylase IME4